MQSFKPVITRHSSWLVINSVQGCPHNCKYCFLKKDGLTSCKPKVLCSPEDTVRQLLHYKFYDKNTPIVLMVNTDVFSTKDNEIYLAKLFDEIIKNGVKNPITFVTKLSPFGLINGNLSSLKKQTKL